MARIKGITSFSANFEPQAAGPLDARNIVETQADLLLPATWDALDALEYTYLGMTVSVHSDPTPENNAVYMLIAADFTLLTSWLKVGTGGGADCCGKVFVVDVTNDGDGLVGNFLYVPNTVPVDQVVSEATTDDDTVEIHFMAEGGINYSPTVTVDGILCTNLQQYPGDQRLFFGSVSVNVPVTRDVPLVSSTAGVTSVLINRAPAGPEILDVIFINGYPGVQTEVKENDTFDIQIDFEPTGTEPTDVFIQDFGACKAQTISLAGSGLNWGTVHTAVVTVTIDYTSLLVQALPCQLNARNALGTIGNTMQTDHGGTTVDGTNLVNCNDVTPMFIDNGTTFPATQLAFKNTEVGSQDTTVNNFDTLTYSSPHGDFTISNVNTYLQDKPITCTHPGDYNDSAVNFQIDAHRIANDTNGTFTKIIEVADIAPIVIMTQPIARLQTGPAAPGVDYTITGTSNQNLFGLIDVAIPVSGTWQGASFLGGMKIFTRDIKLLDSDVAGTAPWTWVTIPTNRANLNASIQGNEVVGGFIQRSISLDPFATEALLYAEVSDPTKLVLTWSFKPGMVYQPIGTAPPVVNGWTIDAININPTKIIILDTSAANSSSQTSTLTIEETV